MAILLAFMLVRSLLAAETNELVPSDISGVSHESDYGVVTLQAGKLPDASKWDAKTAPPLSLADALAAARSKLPMIGDAKWELSSIELEDFGEYYGYGEWYYLVCFYNVTILKKGDKSYSVIKRYKSVVFMDGTVLVPRPRDTKEQRKKSDVEPSPAGDVANRAAPEK